MICGKRSANQVRKADPTIVNGREYVARQSIALPTIHIRQLFSQFQMQVEKASKQKPEAIHTPLCQIPQREGALLPEGQNSKTELERPKRGS